MMCPLRSQWEIIIRKYSPDPSFLCETSHRSAAEPEVILAVARWPADRVSGEGQVEKSGRGQRPPLLSWPVSPSLTAGFPSSWVVNDGGVTLEFGFLAAKC